MTQATESRLEEELQRENADLTMRILELEHLVKHQKTLIRHRNSLQDYIDFFKVAEPATFNKLIFLDHEQRIKYITESTRKFLGYKTEDEAKIIINVPYADLMSDEKERTSFYEAIKKRELLHQKGILLSNRGKPRYVRSRILHYLITRQDTLIGLIVRIKES